MKKNDPRMTVPKVNWSPKPTGDSVEPPVKPSQSKKELDNRATPNK